MVGGWLASSSRRIAEETSFSASRVARPPNWSLKTEYLHVDLGGTTVTIADPTRPVTADYRFNHAFETARVGVNYHFGAPVVAKY